MLRQLLGRRMPVGPYVALVALVALVVGGGASTLGGCSGNRDHEAVFVRSPAYGRTETCPDNRVDAGVGLGPSADSTRCSFDDARGGGLVQLRGAVLLEAPGGQGVPVGVEQTRVTVHDSSGKQIGRTTTDAQGTFSVSLNLRPGQYELHVVNEENGGLLGRRSLAISDGAAPVIRDLDIVLPVDRRLR